MKPKDGENPDEDALFLEKVLDKLYDFGTKKKKKNRKRKRCDEEEVQAEMCSEEKSVTQQQQHQGHDLAQKDSKVEVVTFQDPRKRLKTKTSSTPESVKPPQIKDKKQSGSTEELSLEKARLEVHRFGITGYKKEQQRVFEEDRAIMLGARPPKKQYVNYKVLQQQIKEKKQKEKEEVDPEQKKKKKRKSNSQNVKKQSTSGPGSGSSGPSGQVGRFKNGMLILSSKEIQKIKGSKRGR